MSFSPDRRTWLALMGAAIVTVIVFFMATDAAETLGASKARLIHEEPSAFAPVVVYEVGAERCLSFETMEETGRQTCLRLDDPDRMVFAYTRMMTSALFVMPQPQNILIIGLGGGTLPTALGRILPNAVIDTVEIDPAVVRVAQTYFGYQPGPRQRVFVQDGREFIEQARRNQESYDMVMLDAFDVDYIPAHLLTVEFFEQIKAVLSHQGVLVANSFARSEIYDRESATYAAVFGPYFNLRSRVDGNRVIIAATAELPSDEVLQQNAQALAKRLAPFGIDAEAALTRYSRVSAEDAKGEPLRD